MKITDLPDDILIKILIMNDPSYYIEGTRWVDHERPWNLYVGSLDLFFP